MMFLHCAFLWILFAVVDSHSPLTEKKAEYEIVINNLQNQINQETLMRLSLLKQVYSLVNDMINVKNEMAAMKNNAEEVRKSTDDLRHEDKKMLNEIEKMKHDHNDTSERIMNVQHEYDKMLSEIEQKMKINQNETSETIGNVQHEYKTMFSEIGQRMKYNQNATSERIVNVQNDLLNVNNSVGFLRNFTDKVYAKYGIQENKMRDLSTVQEKIQSTLGELRNEDQRILSETQRIIANRSENTFEKNLKMREDLERNITCMVNNMTGPLERQDCLESSHCWLLYNFSYDASWNGCEGGSQYVTKTNYSSAPYLGVMTCNSTRSLSTQKGTTILVRKNRKYTNIDPKISRKMDRVWCQPTRE
ncbi:coiled-coil domain-containing protein 158-like isoform X1 [Saccostrea echinata]|uniref:coiled-coil domain-containing protein 158-like isoform X1 n=1 Tax=Saccostrea echinata TaxID=191078 RepID=UPI002A808462|nr:coiled-coil domain-containing protein 158-like isoform X1 [Saccostrea echinata]